MKTASLITRALLLSGAVSVIAACSSGPDTQYLGAAEVKQLTLPPDLIRPQEVSRFELPEAFVTPEDGNRSEVPVLAQLQSARLEGTADFYWLSVDVPVEELYPLVRQFWRSEGYRLEVDEPALGIMKTDWMVSQVGNNVTTRNWFAQLFAGDDYAAIQDQFHTRIERSGANGSGSRVYIAHRGTENQQIQVESLNTDIGTTTDVEWYFRQPEPELEIEKLSRLLVYLGVEQSDVADKVEESRMFAPRVTRLFDADEQVYYLLLKDPLPIAWNRVYHTLQRYDYAIEDFAEPPELVNEPGIIIRDSFIRVETNVEEEESGFFSFFGSGEPQREVVIVNIAEEDNKSSRLVVDTTQNTTNSSAATEEVLSFLYKALK